MVDRIRGQVVDRVPEGAKPVGYKMVRKIEGSCPDYLIGGVEVRYTYSYKDGIYHEYVGRSFNRGTFQTFEVRKLKRNNG